MDQSRVIIENGQAGGDADRLMAVEVGESLRAVPPWLPSKYFYDDRGSELFEAITQLPEYYQTRTEECLLERATGEIVDLVRPRELLELGSGAGRKIRLLLAGMARRGLLDRCTLLDINRTFLESSARRLAGEFAGLEVRGIVGDFTRDLGRLEPAAGRLAIFLAGTFGNLQPALVPGFLSSVRGILGVGGAFLVGVDLVKDVGVLEAAYNDASGVTGEFNLNILRVLNDRLGADFDLGGFEHVAFFDPVNAWIEMRVRALRPMTVAVPRSGLTLDLAAGQEIRTEISCKYTRESFRAHLPAAGLELWRWFTDPEGRFALALLRAA